MQSEKVMTDTEREQLAQIANMKPAISRGYSVATITLLTRELTATRKALEDANAAQLLLSRELDSAREQIAKLERTVKLATDPRTR